MKEELKTIVDKIAYELFKDKTLNMVNAYSLQAGNLAVWLYENGFIIQRTSEFDVNIYTKNLKTLLKENGDISLFCNDKEIIV